MSIPVSQDGLQAQAVSQRFGAFAVLDQVSLNFPAGQITGIVGPNGAGKSTLMDVLGGQTRPSAGAVHFAGQTVTRWPAHRRARAGLTRTFQISRELGALTVLENLMLAQPDQAGEGLWVACLQPGRVRRQEAAAQQAAQALLTRVGLWSLADQRADALSGGQKKLLELCRALMTRPRMVLLDEPAAGVNPVLIRGLCDFILQLRAEGTGFVIVEHNMDMIAALCDSLYVLAEGRVLRHGRFDEVVADAQVAQAYLGAVA